MVYNKNIYILAIMGVFYLAEVVGVATILGISFQTYQGESFMAHRVHVLHNDCVATAKALVIPGIQYCILSEIGSPFPLLWVPILAYDGLLLLLFLYRGCAGALPNSTSRWAFRYDGLLDMIYRHSLLNFLG